MSGDTDRVPVKFDTRPDDADSDEGVVINWFAREGTSVGAEEGLCEIQIEKVSVDVPAPTSGTLTEIVCHEGDEFSRGDTLAWITSSSI